MQQQQQQEEDIEDCENAGPLPIGKLEASLSFTDKSLYSYCDKQLWMFFALISCLYIDWSLLELSGLLLNLFLIYYTIILQ